MEALELKLCDIQGRLFEMSADQQYSSKEFVKTFMNSSVASALDAEFNHLQWAGEEYLMDELASRYQDALEKDGQIHAKDILFWTGYVYRYWHYLTGDSSAKIYRIADANTMFRNYLMFHTMDPSMAIERLIEIHSQKQKA